METILPVCTPPAVVKKLVEALYSGYIDLQQDVEQVLVLANCMQVQISTCMQFPARAYLSHASWQRVL